MSKQDYMREIDKAITEGKKLKDKPDQENVRKNEAAIKAYLDRCEKGGINKQKLAQEIKKYYFS